MDENQKRLGEIEVEYASAQARKDEEAMAALQAEYAAIQNQITEKPAEKQAQPEPEEVTPTIVEENSDDIIVEWLGRDLVVFEVDLPEGTPSVMLWVPDSYSQIKVRTGTKIVVPVTDEHMYRGLSYVHKSKSTAKVVIEG